MPGLAAKERAIRRPTFEFGRRRSLLVLSLVPAFLLTLNSTRVEAQQPQQRPAPWSGSVTPPVSIIGLDDARPFMPLELSRAWLAKVESVRVRRDQLAAEGRLYGASPGQLAEQGAALTGRLRIPVIPVHYSDVPIPYHQLDLQRRLFGTSRGDTMSFSDYWDEVSGGLLKVEGIVAPWVTLTKPARYYLPPEEHGWSSFGRIIELREEVLAASLGRIDFTQFDNDGADGIPDSGDDDGFVDFIAIVYAVKCPGDGRAGGIWPHRAAMPPFSTTSIGANGEPIRIADYVVLPALDPATCGPMRVGVLAHETGHALGLPDLYDYDGSSQGIGAWGLMGTGSHATEHSPAHLGAWAKEQLGWVTVAELSGADSTIAIPPVQQSRTVYRVQGDGREYLLLENRQRMGSDRFLAGQGLLVWSVDPERAELGAWNSDERRSAVGIIAADRRDDLARGRRADSGDTYPGRTGRAAFVTQRAGGMQLTDIELEEHLLTARITTDLPDRALHVSPEVLRVTALAGGHPVHQRLDVRQNDSVTIDWTAFTETSWLTLQRDDDALVLTADPDNLVAGVYTGTIDIRDADRSTVAQVIISFYIAAPGVGQIIATELPWSWGVAVNNGRILQASYGWDQLGLRPRPRVLSLWEGSSHPQTLARLAADALYAPIVDSRDGRMFVLARARDDNYLYELQGDGDARIIASRIGEDPAYGAAVMPDGSIAVAEWSGAISRVRRDGSVHPWMDVGYNIYQIASDHVGNLYAATYSGDVLRVSAEGDRTLLPTGFGPGRLVAIATTPDGAVLAAERGGQGRIVRIDPDGSSEVVYWSPGARFYGLAVDDGFLFALDLTYRQLLRIPLPATPAVFAAND
ncbi:MAG TPA: M6 family metalloprotease domain-containing protein [Longimicrobiales bacterium]|nr:M6 family metalloprotease domain-containing protein [Longimicrobiales bacterium]